LHVQQTYTDDRAILVLHVQQTQTDNRAVLVLHVQQTYTDDRAVLKRGLGCALLATAISAS